MQRLGNSHRQFDACGEFCVAKMRELARRAVQTVGGLLPGGTASGAGGVECGVESFRAPAQAVRFVRARERDASRARGGRGDKRLGRNIEPAQQEKRVLATQSPATFADVSGCGGADRVILAPEFNTRDCSQSATANAGQLSCCSRRFASTAAKNTRVPKTSGEATNFSYRGRFAVARETSVGGSANCGRYAWRESNSMNSYGATIAVSSSPFSNSTTNRAHERAWQFIER